MLPVRFARSADEPPCRATCGGNKAWRGARGRNAQPQSCRPRASARERCVPRRAEGYLADRKHGVVASATKADYRAFKDLDSFLFAFFDLDVDLYRIAGAKRRDFLLHLCLFNFFERIHVSILPNFSRALHRGRIPALPLRPRNKMSNIVAASLPRHMTAHSRPYFLPSIDSSHRRSSSLRGTLASKSGRRLQVFSSARRRRHWRICW
jgi:hypothetical protein